MPSSVDEVRLSSEPDRLFAKSLFLGSRKSMLSLICCSPEGVDGVEESAEGSSKGRRGVGRRIRGESVILTCCTYSNKELYSL